MTDLSTATRVNPELPWPGLAAYTEADAALFFGRGRETAELLRLVQRDPFVLLIGAGGIGKSSLLLAGLFPALRAAEFLPVHVRIDFSDTAGDGPLSRQILDALAEAAHSQGIDGGRIGESDTLWEAFHRAGQRWWSSRQQVIVPVLVIDQAEQLFSLGRDSLRRRQRSDRLLEELSQLVENRAPARVATLLETGEDKHDSFDFESAPVRIVLSIREEFLAHLMPLRGLFPTMGRSELRLLPFTPAQAREAIAKPAATNALLADGAADAIVRFLAGGLGVELPVAPCVLSILGRELAFECQRSGVAKITPDMLPASLQELPLGLYERAFAGLPAGARRFIEDDLVSPMGTRASCSVEEAVQRPEITPAILATLAERQLLCFVGTSAEPRVELSSELLCPIAVASRNATAITARDEAAQRDRNTFDENSAALHRAVSSNHRWAVFFAILAGLSLLAAAGGVVLWIMAQQKLTAEHEHPMPRREEPPAPFTTPRERPAEPAPTPVPPTPAPPPPVQPSTPATGTSSGSKLPAPTTLVTPPAPPATPAPESKESFLAEKEAAIPPSDTQFNPSPTPTPATKPALDKPAAPHKPKPAPETSAAPPRPPVVSAPSSHTIIKQATPSPQHSGGFRPPLGPG